MHNNYAESHPQITEKGGFRATRKPPCLRACYCMVCRKTLDDADLPLALYKWKASNLPNAAYLSLLGICQVFLHLAALINKLKIRCFTRTRKSVKPQFSPSSLSSSLLLLFFFFFFFFFKRPSTNLGQL